MLSTFGAILTFAIELEQNAIQTYTRAAGEYPSGPERDVLEKLERQAVKRKELLERTRREGIVEMSLEPIVGLNREKYVSNNPVFERGSLEQFLKTAIETELRAQEFYSDSAANLTVPEVARVFLKLAKERAEQASTLRSAMG